MQFIDLNVDVVIEIFREYLCIDTNGQVTLMLVCSSWKEIMTNTPSLWNYITIDQDKSGWGMQFVMAASLSKDLPLTITLLYPFPVTSFLKPYVACINSLIIEFRGSTYPEITFETVCWRLGLLGGYRGHVGWKHKDTTVYVTPIILYDNMHQSTDASGRERLRSYLSGIRAVLITDVTLIGEPTKKVPLKTIWDCVGLLSNLTRLRLAGDCIASPSGSNPPTLRLIHLQELHLIAGSSDMSNLPTLSLVLSHIRSAALRYIRLEGPSDLVVGLITLIDFNSVFSELYACFTSFSSVPSLAHQPRLETKDLWPIKLTVDLSGIRYPSLLDAVTCLQPLLYRIKLLTPCHFVVDSLPGGIKEAQKSLGSITLLYNDQNSRSDKWIQVDFQRRNTGVPLPLDEVTFKLRTVDWNQSHPLLHLTRRLYYQSYDGGCVHSPNLWGAEIEAISAETCTFSGNIMSGSRLIPHNARPFTCLTTISSLTEVAIIIISNRLVPELQFLTLNHHIFDFDDMTKFISLANVMISQEDERIICPKLHTLAVKYFPPWPAMFKLVQRIAKNRQDNRFVVKLPSLPHQSILQYLVQSIRGQYKEVKDPQLNQITSWENYRNLATSLAPGCYLCHCSGWTCKSRQTCLRHSFEYLTLITKDSA